MTPDAPADKSQLRALLRARRKAFAAGPLAAAATASIQAHVMALPISWAGQSVASYQAIGSEVDTTGINQALADAGANLSFPRLAGGPSSVLDWDPPNAGLTVVLVPLIGFDKRGGRLGQGGGHYDATLAVLKATDADLTTIGLAFACQEVMTVPHEPHDVLLDWIVTEHGAYRGP
jgi:5-formyltetrahydrofolate cyclo-ligase